MTVNGTAVTTCWLCGVRANDSERCGPLVVNVAGCETEVEVIPSDDNDLTSLLPELGPQDRKGKGTLLQRSTKQTRRKFKGNLYVCFVCLVCCKSGYWLWHVVLPEIADGDDPRIGKQEFCTGV